jgi:hypothetical protein
VAIDVNDSVVIARPVTEVFAFVADHENLPAWTVGVRESQRLTPGPPSVGTRYRIVGKVLGRAVEGSYEVTAFEPDSAFDGTMNSPMFAFSEQYRFVSDGSATRVSMQATVRPRGVFRYLKPIMAAGARRQIRADHRRLKTVFEQH